jgi:hypothetical protein
MEGAEREETLEDSLINEIELALQGIEKLVQPFGEDVLDVSVGQFGAELPEPLFGGVTEHARRCAGDGAERFVCSYKAEIHGAWKLPIEEKKINDTLGRDMAVPLAIHFESTGRPEHGRPLDIVKRSSHVSRRREQDEVLNVEQP